MVHRRGLRPLALGAIVLGACLVACKKPPPPVPVDDAGAPPSDHLATNEIPEGTEKAYNLILPRNAVIVYRLTDAIEVETLLSPEQLSNYVRAHVQTTKVTAGAHTTSFDDAIVNASPKTHLRIDVRPAPPTRNNRSSMLVRDVTPPPPVIKTTDEDAWKNIGRKPDGTPLDPKHMQ